MVYLIHIHPSIHHSRHYLGYCADNRLDNRLNEHEKGQGARLTRVARELGRELILTRVWVGKGRRFERKLKNRKNAPRLCPLCNPKLDTMPLPDRMPLAPRNQYR